MKRDDRLTFSSRLKSWMRNNKPGRRYVKTAYGVRMRANWDDWTFRFCVNGEFGFDYQQHLLGQREPFVFIDIGANQGLYSLVAAQNHRCMRCLAFEPVKATYSLLLRNIKANNCADKIKAYKLAIAPETRVLGIAVSEGHSGLATLRVDKANMKADINETIQAVDGLTLQKIVGGNEVPIHIKIDVEGYEEEVFKALESTSLLNQAESVFYEVNEDWTNNDMLEKSLCNRGFREFIRIGGKRQYDILALRSGTKKEKANMA